MNYSKMWTWLPTENQALSLFLDLHPLAWILSIRLDASGYRDAKFNIGLSLLIVTLELSTYRYEDRSSQRTEQLKEDLYIGE